MLCTECLLWLKCGHVRCNSVCPLCANSGHQRPKQRDAFAAVSPKFQSIFVYAAIASVFRNLVSEHQPFGLIASDLAHGICSQRPLIERIKLLVRNVILVLN